MRTILIRLVLMISVVCLISNPAAAEKSTEKDTSSKKADDTKKADQKRIELRKQIEAKKLEINGSEWQITTASRTGKGELNGPDTLTFQDGMFRSKVSSKAGYTPTNYTITVSEEETGPTIWETMQTKSDGEVSFWRGEWSEKTMSGVISRQLSDKKGVEDYYFSSGNYKQISPESAPEKTSTDEKKISTLEGVAATKVFSSEIEQSLTTSASNKKVSSKAKAGSQEAESSAKQKKSVFF